MEKQNHRKSKVRCPDTGFDVPYTFCGACEVVDCNLAVNASTLIQLREEAEELERKVGEAKAAEAEAQRALLAKREAS